MWPIAPLTVTQYPWGLEFDFGTEEARPLGACESINSTRIGTQPHVRD